MGFFDSIIRRIEQAIEFLSGQGLATEEEGDIDGQVENTQDIPGWYLSGLSYNRDIGVVLYGNSDPDASEEILRDYARANIQGYNDGFYGLGEIDYDGFSPTGEVIEVNL